MKKRHFIFAGILAIIIVLPILSYLSVKSGAEVRRNVHASAMYDSIGYTFPNYYFISHRGDTITSERMHGKVIVLELFSAKCKDDPEKITHPLFELQEDYNTKTLSLRFISLITDSVYTNTDLEEYATRYAARDQWHVVNDTNTILNPVPESYNQYLQKKGVENSNLSCPENVLLIDKNGIVRGCYNIFNEQQYADLYNDILFLIDKKYESQ